MYYSVLSRHVRVKYIPKSLFYIGQDVFCPTSDPAISIVLPKIYVTWAKYILSHFFSSHLR